MYREYRRPTIIILCVFCLMAGMMYAPINTLQAQRSITVATRQTWEYKMVYRSDVTEAQLNQLGAEGWELVTATAGQGNYITFCFKRPK